MSNLINYAKSELESARLFGENDFYDGMTGKAVMELIELFSEQGHSGMSAPIVLSIFDKLARFKPLSAIEDTPDSWNNCHGNTYQHKRLSSVFKDDINGKPYYIDAIVWRDQNGITFTSNDVCGFSSRQYIKIPFIPKTFYIDIIENEKTNERVIKDQAQLIEALNYYDNSTETA